MPTAQPSAVAPRVPLLLFYSYSHKDEALREELQTCLMFLEHKKVIRSWTDRAIRPGEPWDPAILEHLRTSDVILLLVSNDFIASQYIFEHELQVAMEAHERGTSVVVPIMLRPTPLEPGDADTFPFLKLQGLPKDLKPVTEWPDRDSAWRNVGIGIRRVVDDLHARRQAKPSAHGLAPSGAPTATPGAKAPAVGVGGVAAHTLHLDEVLTPVGPAASDAPMEAVVGQFTRQITEAAVAKGGPAPDPQSLRDQALRAIDMPEWKRVLWVDDHPEGNRAAIVALSRLQIEVATVTSTVDALARLAEATADEAFDLVISDWQRYDEGPLAGLRLLKAMRDAGHTQPVIYYHGAFGDAARAAVSTAARVAGAHGEAVLPDELMRLALDALEA